MLFAIALGIGHVFGGPKYSLLVMIFVIVLVPPWILIVRDFRSLLQSIGTRVTPTGRGGRVKSPLAIRTLRFW